MRHYRTAMQMRFLPSGERRITAEKKRRLRKTPRGPAEERKCEISTQKYINFGKLPDSRDAK